MFFCQPKGTGFLNLFLNFDPAEDPRLSRQNVEVFPQLRRKVMGLFGVFGKWQSTFDNDISDIH